MRTISHENRIALTDIQDLDRRARRSGRPDRHECHPDHEDGESSPGHSSARCRPSDPHELLQRPHTPPPREALRLPRRPPRTATLPSHERWQRLQWRGAPRPKSTALPAPSHTAAVTRPIRPVTSASDTSGPATTLAAGDTSDSIANVLTVIGTVVAVAVSVSATGDAIHRARLPSAATNQVSARRAKSTSPATAATDSWKPRSNALEGAAASTPAAATDNDRPPVRAPSARPGRGRRHGHDPRPYR